MSPKIVTAEQMKKLDRKAIEEHGLPAMFLMEKAGLAVATEVGKAIVNIKKSYICVVCGCGNNAGDGFVTARYLFQAGINVKVFCLGSENNFKDDTKLNFECLKKINCPIQTDKDIPEDEIKKADVVVDAIFGIGLNREIDEPYKNAIGIINSYAKKIISVDVPSGLNATTGEIYGCCIKSNTTVTFHLPKKGLYEKEGPVYSGTIVVADIGIPMDLEI